MDQAVWNTTEGRIFETTDSHSQQNISRLAYHADVILIALAPFYFIWKDPRMLLLIQTIVLACGAFFVYLISKTVLKNITISVILALCYLLNPSIQFANLYDFHAVTLSTTFLLAAFYFLLKKNTLFFILFAVLAGTTKEQVWIPVGLLGFYLFIQSFFDKTIDEYKKVYRLAGFIVGIFSFIIFYLLIWHIIPQFRMGQEHFALEYYKDLGDSPSSILKNIIFSPQTVFLTVLEEDRLNYLKQLFLPLGYLSLLNPFFLIFSAADFLINLLSRNVQLHQIYYQYTTVISPFLFISAIYGIQFVKRLVPKIPYVYFALLILFSTVYASYAYGPLPYAIKPNTFMFTKPLHNKKEITAALLTISKDAHVFASNDLASHLSRREYIYVYPEGLEKANIVAMLTRNKPSAEVQLFINQLLKSRDFKVLYQFDNFVMVERVANFYEK